jgi:uncharacterized protein with HEPN domain
MTREWGFFIRDIFDAMQSIKSFVGDMTLEEFLSDEKTRSAVVFKVENIGEAAKNLPGEIRKKYRQVPWTDMAKVRDKNYSSLFWNQFYYSLESRKRGYPCNRADRRKDS